MHNRIGKNNSALGRCGANLDPDLHSNSAQSWHNTGSIPEYLCTVRYNSQKITDCIKSFTQKTKSFEISPFNPFNLRYQIYKKRNPLKTFQL